MCAKPEIHEPAEYHGEDLCPCCGKGAVTGWRYRICADGGASHQESCAKYRYADLCTECSEVE